MMDIKQGQTALAQAMVDDVLAVIYQYSEAVPVVLALGVLDVVKHQLIQDHTVTEEDE
jgi:hypothetical protein